MSLGLTDAHSWERYEDGVSKILCCFVSLAQGGLNHNSGELIVCQSFPQKLIIKTIKIYNDVEPYEDNRPALSSDITMPLDFF
jgi:hypothetical protein